MKNLDTINPAIAHPRTFAALGAVLPFLSGIFCIPLAVGAAPDLPFSSNILAVFSAALSIASLFLIVIPHIFKWDWRAKYFGVSLLYVGSAGFLGLIPWLGILFHGTLPLTSKLLIFSTYFGILTWWCRRFAVYYHRVFSSKDLRGDIYEEDEDAIYYLQRGDQQLFEKKLKFAQFPSVLFVLSFMALAIMATPFATELTRLVGISFIHTFITIAALPIVLMCFGLAVRGLLIFYYYPWLLKRQTGKDVYVLMALTTSTRTKRI